MLTTTDQQFRRARKRGCAVAAFNIFNLESAQAVIAAAESCNAPVILQVNSGAAAHGGWDTLSAIALTLANRSSIEVSLHLDHGRDLVTVRRALGLGFTSVMIDGSGLPFGRNVRLTRRAVRLCHALGVPVEAELGEIHGVEDDVSGGIGVVHTNPEMAAEFVKMTGCSSFAPSIGNAHGMYPRPVRLDFLCLAQIRSRISVPLVLHGGSGLSVRHLRQAIAQGVLKVNFSTELREAFFDALTEQRRSCSRDPRSVLEKARKLVYRVACKRLTQLGWN